MNTAIKIIHKKDLELIKIFINICEENNLKYYMIGGTLLGAIRHRGFIPWDDDMDVAMPREDYNRFTEIFNDYSYESIELVSYKKDKNYKYYTSRLCNTKYKIVENTENKTNIFIDILPIDGFPKNKFIRNLHILKVLYHRMKISFYHSNTIDMKRKRNLMEKILIKIAKKISFNKIINQEKEKEKIDRILGKYSFYNSELVGTIMGAYRQREIVPKKYFGIPTKYKFENIQIKGPEKYDLYLTHIYGEYMKLPKKENRRTHCKYIEEIQN